MASLVDITYSDFVWNLDCSRNDHLGSYFDELLKKNWLNAKDNNCFNYKLNEVETKILQGKFGIVSQLNPLRKKSRRPPGDSFHLKQPFDASKFNFNLVKSEEVLLELKFNGKILNNDKGNDSNLNFESRSSILINAAPITTFHSLVVPEMLSSKPQILDDQSLFWGLAVILLSRSKELKVGFNSMGAMASVNHCHFHVYYLQYPIYVETAACENVVGPLYTFKDHYAPGFVFFLTNKDLTLLINNVMKLINLLLDLDICHNVMICRGFGPLKNDVEPFSYDSVRVCVWARKSFFGLKEVEYYATACCELAGHLPLYELETWKNIREDDVAEDIKSVCLETYNTILPKVKDLFSI